MRVIAVISSPAQDDVIEKTLKSMKLWDPPWLRQRATIKARGPPEDPCDDSFFDQRPEGEDDFSQLPMDTRGEGFDRVAEESRSSTE